MDGQGHGVGESIRVIVCDDAPELRELFRIELEAEGDIDVVGLAGDAEQAIEQVHRLHPDVVLLDLRMPGSGGLEAIPRIRAESAVTRVLVVSGLADGALQQRALQLGAARQLEKGTPAAELRAAVRAVAREAT